MNELDLFSAAIAIPDPGERTAFLDRQCAVRPDLRQRIEQLLDAHFQSNPLLDPTNLNPLREQVDALKVTSDFSNKDELAGTVIAGKYTLIELVGEGGMVGPATGPESYVPKLANVAIRIVGKRHDELVPRASTDALYDALPGEKEITWLKGGHFEIGPDVVDAAGDWLKAKL